MLYLTEPDPRGAMGLGGKEEAGVGTARQLYLRRSIYKTGKVAWRYPHRVRGGRGRSWLLTTAGRLLFGGDAGATSWRSIQTGKPLWHARIGGDANAPQTYMVDGQQYVLVAVSDTLYAFALVLSSEDPEIRRKTRQQGGGEEGRSFL